MNHNLMTPARRTLAVAALVPLMLAVGACSGSGHSSTSTSGSTSAAARMAPTVEAKGTWIKASDSGMSAAFGTLENTGKRPVVITKVSGDNGPMQLHVSQKAPDGSMEMHETKAFTLPAGSRLELKPGGSHLMFMNLTKPLKAGDVNKLTVSFQDGSTKQLTFPVRAYDGAKEKYKSGSSGASGESSGMSGMSHSGDH